MWCLVADNTCYEDDDTDDDDDDEEDKGKIKLFYMKGDKVIENIN